MSDLNVLIEKKRAYVKEQAQKIVDDMIRRNVTTDTLSTCDYPNWDRELHRNMPDITHELSLMGINSTSSVNHGVTDWVFTVRL